MLKYAAETFEARNRDVNIELKHIANEDQYELYWNIVQTELLAGDGPDLILFMEKDFADLCKV